MPTVLTSVIVARPPKEVFDFLADARNLPLWSSGVHRVASEDVAPASGAVYRYHFPGRHRQHLLHCTAYQPCRQLVFRGRRMWSPFGTQVPEFGFRLLPHTQGTFLRLTVTCSLTGPLLALAPMMAMAWRRDLPEDAKRLRDVLCGAPDPAAPAPATPHPVAAASVEPTPVPHGGLHPGPRHAYGPGRLAAPLPDTAFNAPSPAGLAAFEVPRTVDAVFGPTPGSVPGGPRHRRPRPYRAGIGSVGGIGG
jgi:uncharacterized protein YndB with AHSA1/START domain